MKKYIVILAICVPLLIYAQKRPFKYGKISQDELKMESCEFYPEAESMILGKFADINFQYVNDKGFQYKYDVTVRKKIFKVAGKEVANISIRIYEPAVGSSKEELTQVKGFTYNLVDGKEVKTKLTNDEEYKTRLNDYWVEVSFALPDVREGSVIEYSYSKKSDFISNLDTWYFQEDIPVAYSDIHLVLPEYYYYQINQVGNYFPLERFEENFEEKFTITSRGLPTGDNPNPKYTSTLTSISKKLQYIGKNIPPVIEEPFMNNKPNLPARLEFQLMTIQYPNSTLKHMAGSYDKLNATLLDRESFGKSLRKGNYAKEKIEELAGSPQLVQAQKLYYWLKKNVSWNELYSISSDNVGRKTLSDKEGSVSDINLSLVAAYREAGIQSNPIILSTRGHGIVHPAYPNYQDFNYVIASVTIDDQLYLCDAASDMPFGVLPYRCLNGNGWMVSEAGGQWVNLKENASTTSSVNCDMSVAEDKIHTKVNVEHRDYSSMNTFSKYKRVGEEEYTSDLAKSFDEWEFSNFTLNTSKFIDTTTLEFEISRELDDPGIIYLQPITYGTILENPFVREERISPVDFPYKNRNVVIAKIEVPENYVAELPQTAIVKLPEGAGRFTYSASQLGSTITILSNFELSKQDFSPDEYVYLRQFYQMAADKNNEVVVLKKVQ
tara:strand:+ start:865 stop:2859 length:1995 start_codon:yes stop_codon:yes gene_type:complete